MTKTRENSRRRGRFTILGVLAALGLAVGAGWAGPAFAQRLFGFGGPGFDPERMRERAAHVTEHALREIEASDPQRERIQSIVSQMLDDLEPLAERHREQRAAWRAELGRTELDPDALEALRAQALELADQMSARVLRALVDGAAELSPEQRAQLATLATQRRGRRGWHPGRGRGRHGPGHRAPEL